MDNPKFTALVIRMNDPHSGRKWTMRVRECDNGFNWYVRVVGVRAPVARGWLCAQLTIATADDLFYSVIRCFDHTRIGVDAPVPTAPTSVASGDGEQPQYTPKAVECTEVADAPPEDRLRQVRKIMKEYVADWDCDGSKTSKLASIKPFVGELVPPVPEEGLPQFIITEIKLVDYASMKYIQAKLPIMTIYAKASKSKNDALYTFSVDKALWDASTPEDWAVLRAALYIHFTRVHKAMVSTPVQQKRL